MPKNLLSLSFFDVSFFCSYLRSCCRRCFHPCHCHLYNSFFPQHNFSELFLFFFKITKSHTSPAESRRSKRIMQSRAFRSATSPRVLMSYLQLPPETCILDMKDSADIKKPGWRFYFPTVQSIPALISPFSERLINNTFLSE